MPKPPPKKYLPKGVGLLYEDSDLLVIDKPEGLLSVPAHYEQERNALALMTHFYRKGQTKSRKELFPVNRLDRETSGILLFAKSLALRERMHDNWERVEKFYVAVLAGTLGQDAGVLESYLVQDEDYRVHATQDKSRGKLAQTRFNVVLRRNGWTTVRAQLLTGRKNQIRVQFSEIGHAVIGDRMYGSVPAKRLALHAWRMAFIHPRTSERIELESEIPDFFDRYLPEASDAEAVE